MHHFYDLKLQIYVKWIFSDVTTNIQTIKFFQKFRKNVICFKKNENFIQRMKILCKDAINLIILSGIWNIFLLQLYLNLQKKV